MFFQNTAFKTPEILNTNHYLVLKVTARRTVSRRSLLHSLRCSSILPEVIIFPLPKETSPIELINVERRRRIAYFSITQKGNSIFTVYSILLESLDRIHDNLFARHCAKIINYPRSAEESAFSGVITRRGIPGGAFPPRNSSNVENSTGGRLPSTGYLFLHILRAIFLRFLFPL